jgi:hypothetical protein
MRRCLVSCCTLPCITSSTYLILESMPTKVDIRQVCTMLPLAAVCNIAEKPLRHTASVIVLQKCPRTSKCVHEKVSTKVSTKKCPRGSTRSPYLGQVKVSTKKVSRGHFWDTFWFLAWYPPTSTRYPFIRGCAAYRLQQESRQQRQQHPHLFSTLCVMLAILSAGWVAVGGPEQRAVRHALDASTHLPTVCCTLTSTQKVSQYLMSSCVTWSADLHITSRSAQRI